MELFAVYHLQAARRLPHLPAEHPCSRLHGHSFRVQVHVSGPLDKALGWVMDYADLDRAWQPLHEALDHRYLNEVPGLANPTSEHLAIWLWEHLKDSLPGLSQVQVQETDRAGCIYRGD